jgi:hypothetical protein
MIPPIVYFFILEDLSIQPVIYLSPPVFLVQFPSDLHIDEIYTFITGMSIQILFASLHVTMSSSRSHPKPGNHFKHIKFPSSHSSIFIVAEFEIQRTNIRQQERLQSLTHQTSLPVKTHTKTIPLNCSPAECKCFAFLCRIQ